MNELLKKLFEAEVLTEESKAQLEEAFKVQLSEAVEAAKKEAAEATRTELVEQWLTERDALVEAIDSKLNEFLREEMEELYQQISEFRDLEAEFAQKEVDLRGQLAEQLQTDLAELINKIDSFLDTRIASEMEELKEDIDHVRTIQFGKEIFEAFGQVYKKRFVDEDSIESQLRESQAKLDETNKKLDESKKQARQLDRKIKMESVLKPLGGRQREAMEILLRKVATENLEEGYKTFIGRVVKEAVSEGKDNQSEQETKVLAEGESGLEKKVSQGTVAVKTGDNVQQLEEQRLAESAQVQETRATSSIVNRYRQLAGQD